MSTIKDSLFWAEAAKGHIFKVLVDALASIPRGSFNLNKDAILHRNSDEHNGLLFDVILERENFRAYKCLDQKTISLNQKHLQKLLRNVKKKDSVTLCIMKDEPNVLQIRVKPEGTSASKKTSSRSETNKLVFQEEPYYDPLGLPEGGYSYPMIIEAADFQKIKRLTSLGKIINVKMQRNNYLAFLSDADVFASKIECGEILADEDVEPYENVSAKKCPLVSYESVGDNDTSEGDELVWYTDENDDEVHLDGTETLVNPTSSEIVDDGDGFYEASFHTSFFNMLVKLPGLGTQMQFYAPRIPQFPLRIKMNAGSLGPVQVYVKDAKQLAYERSLLQEQDAAISKNAPKKRKKANAEMTSL